MSAVDKMLADGFPVNGRGTFGRTALWLAAYWGHVELVRRLLDCDADPSIADLGLECDTPLHCAAFRGHLQIVALLIEAGADIHAVNNYDRTPFENSMQSVNRERRLQLAALFTQVYACTCTARRTPHAGLCVCPCVCACTCASIHGCKH